MSLLSTILVGKTEEREERREERGEGRMEGVGARLGRSSTRYGPTTAFNGPVRRWKKRWVPLSNPSSNNSAAPAAANGNSPLLVYKWTPVSSSSSSSSSTPAKDSAAALPEEPPRRKFRYVPIPVIEEQRQEAAAKYDEDNKPSETDESPLLSQNAASDMKPDMNDVPMEEAQASNKDQVTTEGSKGTNLDLSLGLNTEGGDRGNDSKTSQLAEGVAVVQSTKP